MDPLSGVIGSVTFIKEAIGLAVKLKESLDQVKENDKSLTDVASRLIYIIQSLKNVEQHCKKCSSLVAPSGLHDAVKRLHKELNAALKDSQSLASERGSFMKAWLTNGAIKEKLKIIESQVSDCLQIFSALAVTRIEKTMNANNAALMQKMNDLERQLRSKGTISKSKQKGPVSVNRSKPTSTKKTSSEARKSLENRQTRESYSQANLSKVRSPTASTTAILVDKSTISSERSYVSDSREQPTVPPNASALLEAKALLRSLKVDQTNDVNAGLRLNKLSMVLSDVGMHSLACKLSVEAIRILEMFPSHRESLASALHNQAIHFSNTDNVDAALRSAQAAVNMFRALVVRNKEMEPSLALSLNALASYHSKAGDQHRALNAAQESATLFRQLHAQDSDAYEVQLAVVLSNLSNRLSDVGEQENALKSVEDSVEIYERLYRSSPDEYAPEYATACSTCHRRLLDCHKEAHATDMARTVVRVRRLLYDRRRVSAALFAEALWDLADVLLASEQQGDVEEARGCFSEAVALFRKLVQTTPDRYCSKLAHCLRSEARCLMHLDRHEEALPLLRDAIRRFELSDSLSTRAQLASTYTDAYVCHTQLGAHKEALRAASQAVQIRRDLLDESKDQSRSDCSSSLASSLENLASCYNRLNDMDRMSETLQEALYLYETLYSRDTKQFRHRLATVQYNLSVCLNTNTRTALYLGQQAKDHFSILSSEAPAKHKASYLRSLINLSMRHTDSGNHTQALAMARLAHSYRFDDNPELRMRSIQRLACCYRNLGRPDAAEELERTPLRR